MAANLTLPDDLQRSVRFEPVDFYAAFKDLTALQLYPSIFAARTQSAKDAATDRLRALHKRFEDLQTRRAPPPAALRRDSLFALSQSVKQLNDEEELSTPHTRLMNVLAELSPLPAPDPDQVMELQLPLTALCARQQQWIELRESLTRAQDRVGRLTLLVAPEELSRRGNPDETLYTALLRAASICLRLQDAKTVNGLIALFKDCTKKFEEVFAALLKRREGVEPVAEAPARPEEIEGVLCALEWWQRHAQSRPVAEQLLPLSCWVEQLAEEGRAVTEDRLREQLDALDAQLRLNEQLLAGARHALAALLPLAASLLK